ncbi:MAG: BamA/TamA family outer membrane protein [Bacteroidales bacterium]|nr:BamA/TamA family outer membrane protein [Bacteroidales bacterium]
MLKHLLGFIFISVLFCLQPIGLSAQNNFEVRKISLKGNKTLNKDFLLERMAMKEVSWLQKKLTKKEPYLYSVELTKLDLERLKRLYQTEGFLNVGVKLGPLEINEKKKTVKLTIEIDEGEAVSVDSISFELTAKTKNVKMDSLSRKVLRQVEMRQGDRFRDQALMDDIKRIENAFKNLGYAYASATYDLFVKPTQKLTSIEYQISPGQLSHIGATRIVGNKHVAEKFIRKQLKYEEGEIYNRSLLEKTRKNLYKLQLFRVVSVLPQMREDSSNKPIPVRLYVEEAPRLNARVGAGYGTEDKFRSFLDLTYLGFLGGARRLNLQVKHSAILPYSVSLRWIQPRLFGANSNIEINPYLNRTKEPGYDTRTVGLKVPVGYEFNQYLNASLTYYFEDVEQTVEPNDPDFKEQKLDKFPYNKSGVILGTAYNDSRPQFSPTQGTNVSVALKVNGYFFGGDFSYTRLWGTYRTYRQIGDFTLAFKLLAGGIKSSDSSKFIPVEDRFYSGGSTSVRGWNRDQLGPKRESGSPRGGSSVLESSIELRLPLFWRLSAVAFLDIGNTWEEEYTYRLNELAYAVGPGLRIETPIGPVRFDVGFPVWNEKKSPQFFISVGQAF